MSEAMSQRRTDRNWRGEMENRERDGVLGSIEKRSEELRRLYHSFLEHEEKLDSQWVKDAVGTVALVVLELETTADRLEQWIAFGAAMWQAGYEAAPKLEFVLQEGAGG